MVQLESRTIPGLWTYSLHFTCQCILMVLTDRWISYHGRFSNGLVWAEYVAGNLSLPLFDYAVGGATTSNSLEQGYTGAQSTIPVPSVMDQVASFLENTTPQGSNFSASQRMALLEPLFVVFAGANDVIFNPNISASQSYEFLVQAQNLLRSAYPEAKVLTLSPPDLSRLPYGFYIDNLAKQQLRTYTHLLGDLLDTSKTDSVNVDLRSLFDNFDYYATPQAYGFKPLGKYGSCLVGTYGEAPNITSCDDAEKHVYWDEYQWVFFFLLLSWLCWLNFSLSFIWPDAVQPRIRTHGLQDVF